MDITNLEERYICLLQEHTGETDPDKNRMDEGIARLHSILIHVYDHLCTGQIPYLCECLEMAAKAGRQDLCGTLRSVIKAISFIDFDDAYLWLQTTDE